MLVRAAVPCICMIPLPLFCSTNRLGASSCDTNKVFIASKLISSVLDIIPLYTDLW